MRLNSIVQVNLIMHNTKLICILAMLLCLTVNYSTSLTQTQMFPYGPSNGDVTEAPTDDGYARVTTSIYFPFFGNQHNQLYVDTNGVLTFDAGLSDWKPESFPLSDNVKIIAPFWADVDCTAGNDGRVFYRQSTDDQLLASGTAQIKNYFTDMDNFEATWMFVATWWNVTFFGGDKNSPTDTFQCALVTDGNDAFAIFNYLHISWTTGISDGGNSHGLGGIPAQVGFDAGDGVNYFALPQSQTNDVLYIGSQSNLNPSFPGKFIYQINAATIHNLPTVTIKTCRATTDPHFTTFDGAYYSPQEPPGPWFLAASPVTVPDNTTSWSVSFRTSFWYGNPYATCITSVEIDVDDQVVEFGMNGFLRINGLDTIAPWYYVNGENATIISVVGYGLTGHLLSTTDMVKVSFTGSTDYTLTIQAPLEIYGNDTEGVCGNMNGNPNDDPTCPTGGPINTCWQRHHELTTTESPTTLHPHRTTSASLETTTSYFQCDPRVERQIKEKCSLIISPFGPFQICATNATALADEYYQSCIYDLCATSNYSVAFCSLLQSYADACMQQLPSVTLKWRSEDLCPPNCSAHMHYDNCASSCPATCSNPNAPLTCPLPCRGDCTCDDGYLLDNGQCIDPNKCGCTDNQGYHPYGSHWVTKNCKEECTCGNNHIITCVQEPPCDKHAKCTVLDGSPICHCLPGYTGDGEECSPIDYCSSFPCKNGATCISQNHGYKCQCSTGYSGKTCQNAKIVTCHANGDPHFTTFDGAYYSPQEPPGPWFLAAQPANVPAGTLPWAVWFSTQYYYGNHKATCIVNLEIDVAGQVVEFGMFGFLRVNGINRVAPWYYPNKENAEVWVFNNGWYGHTLGTKDLITVSFSGATDYSMKIQAPYHVYTNDTEGVCGNMNGNRHDDPICPGGGSINTCWQRHHSQSTTVQPTTLRTTPQFHTSAIPPVTTTEFSPNCGEESQQEIDEECSIVLNSTGPFGVCVTDASELALNYYNSCIFDMCVANQSDALCSLLQSYADACTQAVPNLQLQWRTAEFCPPNCPVNSHYLDCASSCPATCNNPQGPSDCSSPCQGSCVCDSGYVFDGGNCILPKDCGCLDSDGYYHQYGSNWVMNDCTENCTCMENHTTYCASKRACDIHGACTPHDGDESCKCLPGYTGDGETCTSLSTTPEHTFTTQSSGNFTTTSNFNCNGKVDGDYPDPTNPCSSVWYKCAHGVDYPQLCPENTVFDSQLDQCVWPYQLPACSVTTRLPPTTTHPETIETCRASGDPHFTTFDGAYYSPQPPPGPWFLAAKPLDWPEETQHWSVWFSTMACSSTVTCIVKLQIIVDGQIVDFGMNGFLRINNLDVIAPWYYPNKDNASFWVMNYGSTGHTLSTTDRVSVTFSGSTDYSMTLQVPREIYFNDTEGFCGNMNDNPNDDPICPDGEPINTCWERHHRKTTMGPITTQMYTGSTLAVTTSANLLCDPQTQQLVDQECSIITDPSGPFSACVANDSSLASDYYSSCTFDLCAYNNPPGAICQVLQSYADACMQNLPDVILSWRSAELCPPNCSANMHYEDCAPSCPATCSDPNGPLHCSQPCRGGCECDSGYFLDNGQCVQSDMCGCVDPDGYYHQVGSQWMYDDCQMLCLCSSNHSIVCVQTTPCDMHAACIAQDGQDGCYCSPGYTGNGLQCSPIDYCVNDPCENGGTCVNDQFSYECRCSSGYDGKNCENKQLTTATFEPTSTVSEQFFGNSTMASNFNCNGKVDGDYPDPTNPCSSVWYKCAHGVDYPQLCPENTVFDSQLDLCVWPYQLPACSVTTQSSGNSTIASNFNCNGKVDGDYPDPTNPCSSVWYKCAHGVDYPQLCPENTVFDSQLDQCVWPYQLPACSVTTQSSGNSTMASNFNCNGKVDGDYPDPTNPCSSVWYKCAHGVAYPQLCPENTVFDSQSDQCVWPYQLPACSVTTQSSGNSTMASNFNCNGKVDGDYPDPTNPCSTVWYKCAHGVAYPQLCPENTVFDSQSDQCVWPYQLPACSVTTQSSGNSTMASNFNCNGKVDGDYPDPTNPCSSVWYKCAHGVDYPQLCPENTVFDSQLDQCVWPYQLPACSVTTQSSGNSTMASNFNCNGKVDGDYPDPTNPCSSVWYKCAHGVDYPQLCPENTVFDSQSDQCVWPYQLPACSVTTRLPPTTVYPETMEICRASGDPHFTTFDGAYYSPQPPSGPWFLAAKPLEWSEEIQHWSVWFSTMACSSTVTCIVKLQIIIEGQIVDFGMNGFLQINNLNVIAPWYYPNKDNASFWVMNYGSTGHTLSTTDRVSVTFSGSTDYSMTVQVPREIYFNDTEGFCGNMNDNPNDDPICPDGEPINTCWERHHRKTTMGPITTQMYTGSTLAVTTSANLLCDPQTQQLVDQECSIITDPSGPFSACVANDSSLASDYYSSCTFDLCAYNNPPGAICQVLQSYADACMQDLPDVILSWRSAELCPPNCSANMHYEDCAPSCPATCSDPSGPLHCSLPCKGGCECDSGYLYDNGQCVQSDKCGCVDPDGYYHQDNTQWVTDDCQSECSCNSNHTILCVPKVPCDIHAKCIVYGGNENCYCLPGYTGDGEICREIDYCVSTPCKNGGTCVTQVGGYTCNCPSGYGGTNCEERVSTVHPTTYLPITTTSFAGIFNCTGKPNGNYANPANSCSNTFYTCSNGLAYNRTCAPNLVYNEAIDQCVYPYQLPACGITPTEPPIISTTEAGFNCNGKPNGNYGDPVAPCSNTFYSCYNGRKYPRHCQPGMVFDPENNVCVYPSELPACSYSSTTEAVQTTKISHLTTTAASFNCMEKQDGNYPDPSNPCSNIFYTCSNGIPYQRNCEVGLVYDSDNDQCVYPYQLPSCGVTTQVYHSPTTTQSAYFNCSGKPNGNYADPTNPCTNKFYMCSGGHTVPEHCEFGLVFDPLTGNCQIPSVVPGCQVSTSENPLSSTQSIGQLNCTDMPNGDYANPANPCSSVFYTCSNGITYVQHCAEPYLVFDESRDQCVYQYQLPACSSTSYPTRTGQTVSTKRTETSTFQPPPPGFNCTGISNGDYTNPSDPCSGTYYTCSNGLSYQRQCPANLVFDQSLDACVYSAQLPACQNASSPTTSGALSSTTTESISFDCQDKQDGNYPDPNNPCSHYFWYCSNGVAYTMECPGNLVYDAYDNHCTYPENLPACNNETSTTPTHFTAVTTSSSAVNYNCTGKSNGNYVDPDNPCSHYYYTCTDGEASKSECPGNYVFDPEEDGCTAESYVPACQGSTVFTAFVSSEPRTSQSMRISSTSSALSASTTGCTTSIAFDCKALGDGDYVHPTNPCSTWYLQCTFGHARALNCPQDLYFDVRSSRCLDKRLVPACF